MANDTANPFDQITNDNPFDKLDENTPDQATYSSIRQDLADELRKDPGVVGQFLSLTKNEVGGQGQEAQQAFMESVFNRAHARGKPLSQVISDPNYFPRASLKPTPLSDTEISAYGPTLASVIEGSNISNNATGNASGSVGFAGGPQVASYGGERFGIEGPDLGRTALPYNPFDTVLSEGLKPQPTEQELATLETPQGSPNAQDVLRARVGSADVTKPPPEQTPIGGNSLQEAYQTGGLVGAGAYISNMADIPGTADAAKLALRTMFPAWNQLNQLAIAAPESPPGQIASGLEQGVADIPAMLSSPTNLALMAGGSALPGAIGKVATGWFMGQMARQVPQQFQQFVNSPSLKERTRLLIGMASTIGLIGAAGKSFIGKRGAVEKMDAAVQEAIDNAKPAIESATGMPAETPTRPASASEPAGRVETARPKKIVATFQKQTKAKPAAGNEMSFVIRDQKGELYFRSHSPKELAKMGIGEPPKVKEGVAGIEYLSAAPEAKPAAAEWRPAIKMKSGRIFKDNAHGIAADKAESEGYNLDTDIAEVGWSDNGFPAKFIPSDEYNPSQAAREESAKLRGLAKPAAAEFPNIPKQPILPRAKLGIVPQPGPFLTEDVVPTAKAALTGLAKIKHEIVAILSPSTVSETARAGAGMIREHAAQKVRSDTIARTALRSAEKAVGKLPEDTQLGAMIGLEKGEPPPKELAGKGWDTYKAVREKGYADLIKQVRSLNPEAMQHLIEDYMPHIWTQESIDKLLGNPAAIDPSNPWAAAFGKRPLAGRASFLKQRTIPTIEEGLALGLVPVSNNPVTMDLLKMGEINRYIMGQRIMQEAKESRRVKFVPAGARGPVGYTQINDKIARVSAPKGWKIVDEGGNEMPGQKLLGHYWAEDDYARVVNNFLSPGLRGNALYDAPRYIGNVLNQVQLGVSMYHAMFTAIDTAASSGALGIEQIARSGGSPKDIARGAANIGKSLALAPVGGEFLTKLWQGNKFLKEYSRPGTTNAELAKIVDAAIAGGARPRMDTFYKTGAVDSFFNALKKGNYAGALLRVPFATIEVTAKPLMEYAVPRLKLGVISQMLQYELGKLPEGATREQVRKVSQRVVDSVDNRMGQMIYDNLFWNKTLKDSLMASIRSVGWNLGDIRELGGGALDTVTAPKRALRSMQGRTQVGENPVVTHRMAYLAYYPIIVGTLGAMYQYLKTGESPRDMRDLYMPRTGQLRPDGSEERVILPTYMKDIMPLAFAGARHGVFGTMSKFGQMALNKLHPVINTLGQMWQNKDYYGTAIRNEDDPAIQQVMQEMAYMAKQFIPFSVRGFGRRQGGIGPKVEAIGGIMPAPRELTMTAAEEVSQHIWTGKFEQAPRTKEAASATQLRSDLAGRARDGDPQALWEAQRAGQITPFQRKMIERRVKMDPLQYQITRFTPLEAMRVWDVATPLEKSRIEMTVRKKIINSKSLKPEDRAKYLNILRGQ